MNAVINIITKYLTKNQNFNVVMDNDGRLPKHVVDRIQEVVTKKSDREYNIQGVSVELRRNNKQLVATFQTRGRVFPDVVVMSNE